MTAGPRVRRAARGAARRGWRGSARRRGAAASGRASASAPRSGSCARRAPARSSPPSTSVSASSGADAAGRAGRDRVCGRARPRCCCVYVFAGRAVIDPDPAAVRGPGVERALGVVLIATACRDGLQPRRPVRGRARPEHQPAVDLHRPDEVVGELERRPEPARLAAAALRVRRAPGQGRRDRQAAAERVGVSIPGVTTPALSVLGTAPEFTDNQDWFNTPGDKPLTMAGLRGHVVLVDFWTYTCINCIRTLPYLKGMYATTTATGWTSSASRRPSSRSSRRRPTSARRSRPTGSNIRSSRTTVTAPGTPTQPVLAGRVLHRRQGQDPPRQVRRGRLRAGRGGDPRAAVRGRRPPPAAAGHARARSSRPRAWRPRRPTSTPNAPSHTRRTGSDRCCRALTPTRGPRTRRSTSSR